MLDGQEVLGAVVKFDVKFEKRDLWIGLFWDVRDDGIHIFVCPFPCIALHWVIERR